MVYLVLTVIGLVAALVFLDMTLIRHNRGSKERKEHLPEHVPDPEAWIRRGRALFAANDLEGAKAAFGQTLELTDQEHLVAQAEHGLGMVDLERNDLDSAEERFKDALARNQALGRFEGMAAQHGNLGLVARRRGDLEGAEACHREALRLEEQVNHREGIAAAHYHLGQLAWARGNTKQGREHLEQALTLFREAGSEEEEKRVRDLLDRLAATPPSGA